MLITEVMGVVYDEDRLSIEEQDELEKFCSYLADLFDEKIKEMGLHIVEGCYMDYVTKFNEEELKRAITIEEYNKRRKINKNLIKTT